MQWIKNEFSEVQELFFFLSVILPMGSSFYLEKIVVAVIFKNNLV